MKRQYLNFLVILLIAAVLTAAFSACKNDDDDTSLDELNAAVSRYEEMLESAEAEKETENQKGNFVVVIPSRCGADLFGGADLLCDELSKRVGYDVQLVYDSEHKKSSDYVEILVGETDRAQSTRYIKELRIDDYGYECRDGSLQIGAPSEALCVEAIKAFIEAFSNGDIDLLNINGIKPYRVCGNYEIDKIELCGFPIYEYDIVYPKSNTMHERELAGLLRDEIAEYSGYSLRVISDKQITSATRAICIGKTSITNTDCAENEAIISVNNDENIELVSDKNSGIYYSIQRFLEMIKQSQKNGQCSLELFGTKNHYYNGDEISFCIVRDDFTDESVSATVNAVSVAKGCSVSVFDSLSQTVEAKLSSGLETFKSTEGNNFYYADGINIRCVYEKGESLAGGGELLVLVMERTDGNRFAFICGFGNGTADAEELLLRLNEECKKYSDIPIVAVHDLDDSFDRRFDDANDRLCAVNGYYGLYYSSDKLIMTSASSAEICGSVSADILAFDFYYI